MSVKVKYRGSEILNVNTNVTKTLKTSGKYCDGDIEVQNTQDGGITPTGTINITSNGTHDVSNYASANVNVPVPNVYEVTFTLATHKSTDVELLTMPDNVYAHINDTNFYVNMFCTTPESIAVNDDYAAFCCNNENYPSQGSYTVHGVIMRKSTATGVQPNRAYYPPKEATNATSLGSSKIWHNGKKLMFKSNGYYLGAGTYKIILGW